MSPSSVDVRLIGSHVRAGHPWLRSLWHLSSKSRNRTSASFAASTGSRAKAERSASFSQKDAAGSDSTCSTSSSSAIPLLGRDLSHFRHYTAAHNCARLQQMAVTASDTTRCGSDANDRVVELGWQTRWFATAAVKDGTHSASELCIFAGEIHL